MFLVNEYIRTIKLHIDKSLKKKKKHFGYNGTMNTVKLILINWIAVVF